MFDACVLYPAQTRDLLLRVARTNLFKARWSAQIQDEWINALLRTRPELQARLQRTRELIDQSVPDCLVRGFEAHIEGLELPDADDRHVLAAAIHCQAGVIVTANLKDFPEKTLKPLGIAAQHPDEFLTHVFDLSPGAVISANFTPAAHHTNIEVGVIVRDQASAQQLLGFVQSLRTQLSEADAIQTDGSRQFSYRYLMLFSGSELS